MKILAIILCIISFSVIRAQELSIEHQIIRTTGFAVHSAHKASIANQVLTGNLSRSIEHQRIAVQLFKTGNVTEAVYHSLYARKLAFTVMEANKMKISTAFEFNEKEKEYEKKMPSTNELDKKLEGKKLHDNDYLIPQLEGIDL